MDKLIDRNPFQRIRMTIPYVGNTDDAPTFVTINSRGLHFFMRDISGLTDDDLVYVKFGDFSESAFPRKGKLAMPPAEYYDKVTIINTSTIEAAVIDVVLSLGPYDEALVAVDGTVLVDASSNTIVAKTWAIDTAVAIEVAPIAGQRDIVLTNESDTYNIYLADTKAHAEDDAFTDSYLLKPGQSISMSTSASIWACQVRVSGDDISMCTVQIASQ
jgi:hypothetical protein